MKVNFKKRLPKISTIKNGIINSRYKCTLETTTLWIVTAVFLFQMLSCNRQEEKGIFYARLVIEIKHKVEGATLRRDTLAYHNRAGQLYEVSKLEYYISDFWLKNKNEDTGKLFSRYVRDSRSETLSLQLDSLTPGSYDTLKFIIGIPSTRNYEMGLPPTIDNLNMAWPEPMGGGYHFLRLEGRYRENKGPKSAFALHLGKNENLVKISIPGPFNLQQGTQQARLTMNINEWFQTPYTYDLNIDPNYTMSDSAAMKKISKNGEDAWNFRIINK